MQLVINGQNREFPELLSGANLSDLVTLLGLKNDRVAIERNGEIVSRSTWESAPIQSGDRLEIVHFVGGGKA